MTRRRGTLALALAGCAVAACSSGESILQAGNDDVTTTTAPPVATAPPGETLPPTTATTVAPTTTTPLSDLPPCPVDALDEASAPVEITVWYGLGADVETAFVALVDRYNASQDKVVVRPENQGTYNSTLDKYVQGSADSRPEVVMFPEYLLQQIADTDSTVPIGACIEASDLDTSPLLERALRTYQTEGVQWSMPFNLSVPVLFYNQVAFEAAGLPIDDPPVSLDELRADSQAIVDAGSAAYGIVVDSGVDTSSWFLEQWFARVGQAYANNGNGRLAPATNVEFAGPTGVALMTELQLLVQDGLAVAIGDNPSGFDQLFKLADQQSPAAMAIASSAALGTVIRTLEGGGFPVTADQLGIGPMPGPGEVASATIGGASLWIVAGKGDAEAAAAWDFVQFATSAEQQSQWAAETGYTPMREDALALDPIRGLYETDPRYKVAYDQIVAGGVEPTSLGPVLGPLLEVRVTVAGAVASIFAGADVASSLAAAAVQSDALIAEYNARN